MVVANQIVDQASVKAAWNNWENKNRETWQNIFRSTIEGSECIDAGIQTPENCIENLLIYNVFYGRQITLLPDAEGQRLFDEWLINVENSLNSFQNGDYDASVVYYQAASTSLKNWNDYVEDIFQKHS